MGLFSYLSLIPAMQGNIGQAFAFMGVDFLLDSQERKDREEERMITLHNHKAATTPNDLGLLPGENDRFMIWAVGGEKFPGFSGDLDTNYTAIKQWNFKHGDKFYLSDKNPLRSNVKIMVSVWIDWGKPD